MKASAPFFLAVLLLTPLVTAPTTDAASPAKPNILLIITDDQGYGDFSIHGNPHVRTPYLDQLGKAAVRFDRFYVNSFCAPTRAALLTGRWPLRCGVYGVTHNREAMRPDEVTIAEALRGAGYRTACIGKWHNGEQYPYTPPGQGFQEFFGFHNGHWNNYFDTTLLRGAKPEKTRGYITDVFTDEAIKWIAHGGPQPFFCYLAYNAPHSPFQVPDKYFDRLKARGFDDAVAAYWGMCENLDDNIGRLLAELDRLRLADNTIVLFLTDNGGTVGVKLYNAGMRGGKTSVHEGGTRVPLFMHWPAAQWPPHVARPIVAHIDLYPTLLDLCGVPPPLGPRVDGISLRPLLESSASAWPERVLFTHNPIDEKNKFPGAVRTQRYRLVCEIRGKSGGSSAVNRDASATPWQLYDMENDPGEQHDLAKDQPQRVAELSRLYDAWFADISRDGLRRFPIPVGYAKENPVEIHAPQAYFRGPMRFHSGPGFANDWLTGWTYATDKLWFDLDVVRAGVCAIEIAYACVPEDAGAKIRVSAGEQSLEATVPAASIKPIPLAHRDKEGHDKYQSRDWATLRLGTLNLPRGAQRLTIEALSKPGAQVMDFKHVQLRRHD